jgi:hypothetical protein
MLPLAGVSMKSIRIVLTAVLLFSCIAAGADPERKAVFGLLHGHTSFSDGSGTPAEAYTMARSAGVDFFAITEHNHAQAEAGAEERTDGVLIATQPGLYTSPTDVTVTPHSGVPYQAASVMQAAKMATTSTFLALYGQEFSTISSGNHVNVFDYPEVLTIANGDFVNFFKTLQARPGPPYVVQLNHPDVHGDQFYTGNDPQAVKHAFNDYGFTAFGADYAKMTAAVDPNVRLIEVLSGPAMHKARDGSFRYESNEDDYYFYLVQGFHVSPSAGQDNHYKTWGTITDARTGAYVTSLSKDALLQAFRENRTFATEDQDLQLSISVNGADMGSAISVAQDKPLAISVSVIDPSDSSKAATIELIQGVVAPAAKATLVEWKPADHIVGLLDVTANGTATFPGFVASGAPEFFYARVKQADGDRAWSGPIWINSPTVAPAPIAEAGTAEFAWTKSSTSKIYHYAWCNAVKQIKAENLVIGDAPPANRTLHDCKHAEGTIGH